MEKKTKSISNKIKTQNKVQNTPIALRMKYYNVLRYDFAAQIASNKNKTKSKILQFGKNKGVQCHSTHQIVEMVQNKTKTRYKKKIYYHSLQTIK